jgi:hypothetical protein
VASVTMAEQQQQQQQTLHFVVNHISDFTEMRIECLWPDNHFIFFYFAVDVKQLKDRKNVT